MPFCSSPSVRKGVAAMNRRIRLTLPYLALLVVLLGAPVLLTWRAVRQERLNSALFRAIRHNDTFSVSRLLSQGADPNAPENVPVDRSFRRRFLDRVCGK